MRLRPLRHGATTLAVALGLVIAFAVANGLIAWQIERRIETSLENRLGFSVEVDLSDWPVVPRLLVGSVPQAQVTARNVVIAGIGARVSLVQFTLEDVRWKRQRRGLLDLPIQAESVRFKVEATEENLEELLSGQGRMADVRLADGRVRLTGAGGLATTFDVVPRGGGIVLRPEVSVVDFEVYLPIDPIMPDKTRVERVLVEDGRLILTGSTEGLGITSGTSHQLTPAYRAYAFTTDVDRFFEAYGGAAGRLAEAGCRPASTLLGVTHLAYPKLLVEIEATALA